MSTDSPDFACSYHGSTCAIRPLTEAANEWLDENVQTEGYQWMGKNLIVETRYFEPILTGLLADGLRI